MLNMNNKLPLYEQIYQDLLQEILQGKLQPNSLIPTEKELITKYSVSRITIRQALSQLKDRGYIIRKSGKGSYVKRQPIEQTLSNFYSFSDDLEKKGFEIENKVLRCEKQIVPNDVAAKLGIFPHANIILLERIRSVENISFAYEQSYLPFSIAQDLTKESIEKIGLYKSLKELGQIPPNSAQETFEAIMPSKKIAKLLNMNERQPALQIDRITKSDTNIIEYCKSIVRGDRIKYNVMLTAK